MQHKGWQLSVLGFGGVPLSFGERPSASEAAEVLQHALNCGINFIDTANAYCRDASEVGHNERLIAASLKSLSKQDRHSVKIFTKGGYTRPGGAWVPDGRPAHIRSACEHSLLALGAEQIDLYQHHTPDPAVPVADTIGEFARLKEEGKVLHIGVSNYSVEQIDAAREVVEVQSVQNEYSPRHREPEADGTLAGSSAREMAFIPWSPLGGLGGSRTLGDGLLALEVVAAAHGVSVHRVALAWLLSKGANVFPIPGASRKVTLEDSAKAAELVLEPDQIERLDREIA